MFPLCPLFGEFLITNEYWILSKAFWCIYWDNHVVFIFKLLIWYIDGFSDTEPSSHPWDKSHWIMLYDPSNVLLDSVNICWGFLHLRSSVILAYNFLFCDMFVWFYYLAEIGLIEVVEKNLVLHNFGE